MCRCMCRCRCRRDEMSQDEAVFIFGTMGLSAIWFVIAGIICHYWNWGWACWTTPFCE